MVDPDDDRLLKLAVNNERLPMSETDLLTSPLTYVVAIIGLFALLIFLAKSLVNVGAKEIAIKERCYIGSKTPPGRVIALEGEIGVQADVLKPGLRFIKWPFERLVKKAPLIKIGPNEIGVIEAMDGEALPPGRILAPDRARNSHNNFQDPAAFIKNGGVKGVQTRTLPPGLWAIHPYLFRVSVAKAVTIPQGKIGVVTASDGAPLEPGRLLGMAVEGHRNFQDADRFIQAAGQKGQQAEILTPGTYRILTDSIAIGGNAIKPGLFRIQLHDVTVVNENQVGLVEALDGAPLNPREYDAAAVQGHNDFQNGHEFIRRGGRRGPQKDLLLPGAYHINPFLFKVIIKEATEAPPGNVVVIVSNVGKDPTEEVRRLMAAKAREKLEFRDREQLAVAAGLRDKPGGEAFDDVLQSEEEMRLGDPAGLSLDAGAREAYVAPDGYRGIQETALGPGRYYLNTLAVTPVVIPTTNQMVEWSEGQSRNGFGPFEALSKDGFTLRLEVRVVFRIKPEDAPFMVAKAGSIDRLVKNVVDPLIDSIFRGQASESSATAYLQNRHEKQRRAEARVRRRLLTYHVDVVNLLIRNIRLPEDLMKTQTEKVLVESRKAKGEAHHILPAGAAEAEKAVPLGRI
jgi:uncharacterized membrane protein YqiK